MIQPISRWEKVKPQHRDTSICFSKENRSKPNLINLESCLHESTVFVHKHCKSTHSDINIPAIWLGQSWPAFELICCSEHEPKPQDLGQGRELELHLGVWPFYVLIILTKHCEWIISVKDMFKIQRLEWKKLGLEVCCLGEHIRIYMNISLSVPVGCVWMC